MVNRVILIGNLGRDPEIRRLENGAAVAKFSVATNENYQDKSGEWQTQTEWHEVVAWRNRAEQAEKTLKKGSLVYIEGKLTHRKYTDQNNIERYRTEVVANYLRRLKDPDGSGSGYFPDSEHDPSHGDPASKEETAAMVEDVDNGENQADDLPF